MYWVALFAVKICEPIVRGGGGTFGEAFRGMVFEPIMRAVAEGAREIGVPERVMRPPGVRVGRGVAPVTGCWLLGGEVVKAAGSGMIGDVVRI